MKDNIDSTKKLGKGTSIRKVNNVKKKKVIYFPN